MNRIDRIFSQLRSRSAKGLMPFLTAGDPDLAATGQALKALQRAGAHICELGFPFSDPIADGPIIQASMAQALSSGVTPRGVLDLVAGLRAELDLGLVAMVSYSIVHRLGLERFVAQAREAGFDGFILPDLPLEESQPARRVIAEHGMILSMLVAPTTPDDRALQIAQACTGFVYLVARAGITGESGRLAENLPQRIGRLRQVTDLPIAVGFGVSDRQQVREVVRSADAAIIGSAIMRRVAQVRSQGPHAVAAQVESFVRDLAEGLAPDPAAAGNRP